MDDLGKLLKPLGKRALEIVVRELCRELDGLMRLHDETVPSRLQKIVKRAEVQGGGGGEGGGTKESVGRKEAPACI
jgi:hypothetical protein